MKILMFKQVECGPCKIAEEFVKNELETEADETLFLFAGDKRANELAAKFGVMSTPAFVLVDQNERLIDMVRGANHPKIAALFDKR